jgi:hypothetical protein
LLEGKFIYNQEADQECSVSTGFGATDDGIGCITVLQLIRFFTTPGNEPRKGVVALLNNGEEDYLNGRKNRISLNLTTNRKQVPEPIHNTQFPDSHIHS